MINAKLKSKFFKKKDGDGLEEKTETESIKKDDGFDSLRELRKKGVVDGIF